MVYSIIILDYAFYMACTSFCSQGFVALNATHSPPAQPSHGIEDNAPDANDEADFDIPDTQAVLERFMSNMSKLADDAYRHYLTSSTVFKTLQVIPLPNPSPLPRRERRV
jgi:hypothetical protein